MSIREAVLTVLALGITATLRAQSPAPEDTAQVIQQSRLGNSRLSESSGLASSRRTRGVLWTLNDSGNPPELFALDSAGTNLATFRIEGARNRDWEAVALAPCGRSDCIYIGEVGDNSGRYDSVVIYRVVEPARQAFANGSLVLNGWITFRYEDGPRDAEAIMVTENQDVFVISKERSGSGRVYRIDHDAWETREVVTARFIQELPLPEGSPFQITDASLARNGIDIAIRTYSYIFFFQLRNGVLTPDPRRPGCYAAGLDIQGEGITWLGARRVITTSERRAGLGGTVSIVECR